jgi:hypothetical protein
MIISSKFGFLPAIQGKFVQVRLSQSGLKEKKRKGEKRMGPRALFPLPILTCSPFNPNFKPSAKVKIYDRPLGCPSSISPQAKAPGYL